MNKLAPSILSADFAKLSEQVNLIEEGGAHLIHVDVMDGHFVPNISFGAPVMKSLLGRTKMPFDVHLMIEEPDRYIEHFVTDNTEFITVHAEACVHLHRTIQLIKSFGVKAGVALNPATPISVLDYVIEDIDMALVMSVNPGFGGQKFISGSLDKIKELQKIKTSRNPHLSIEVDGGADLNNLEALLSAGVNIVVAGSAVFGADNIIERTRQFIEKINNFK